MTRPRPASVLVPYPPLLARVARTAGAVWAGLHFALLPLGIVVPALPASLLAAGVCAAAAWLDQARHREHLFFANLGVSPRWSAGAAFAFAAALELALRLAAGAAR